MYFRELYYFWYRSLASQGWFKDEAAKIPHGEYVSFHTTKQQDEFGSYVDGKKEGTWLKYYPDGRLKDSFTFVKGFLSGTQYSFNWDGLVSDSMQFDGKGNGSQVGWFPEGRIAYTGLWTMDTVKTGRWKYYDEEGNLKGTQDYTDGKLIAAACYDSKGNPIDTALCKTSESLFPGESKGWRTFLTRNLNPSVPLDNGAKQGQYTVFAIFNVEKDGRVSNITTLTKHGFGMEQEVVRLLKASPKWKPEMRFGVPVRSLKIQPVTFIVSEL